VANRFAGGTVGRPTVQLGCAVVFVVVVVAYSIHYHLSEKTDEVIEGGGRFAMMAMAALTFMLLCYAIHRMTTKK
jgi:hypothetical protein